MTPQALFELLETTGLPVAYRAWKEPPKGESGEFVPYLVYLFTYDSDLVADNRNYHGVSNWQVELYSEAKDVASEELVEAVLKEAEIPYDKRETYIDSEDMNQVVYVIRTID